MRRSFLSRGAAALAVLALAACDGPPGTSPERMSPEELSQRVEALGFRGDMVRDFGDYVVVEGDIRLTREQIEAARVAGPGDPPGPRFQYTTYALVGSPKVNQITVDLSALGQNLDWRDAAREALTHWSGISWSYVRMVEGGTGSDIRVIPNCNLGSGVAGRATWPSGGNPGPQIEVNPCFSASQSARVRTMVHELGHTIGFRHSNWSQNGESADPIGAVHVPNTPTSGNDNGSVMNGGSAGSAWAGFSFHDAAAAKNVYPLPGAVVAVANSGGTPLLTWGALFGATSYSIKLNYNFYERFGRDPPMSDGWTVDLGTTTGTSFLDTAHPYTGVTNCSYTSSTYTYREAWQYEVVATFANGTSAGFIAAPVGSC